MTGDSSRVLGPPGILPRGDAAIGARIIVLTAQWTVCGVDGDDGLWIGDPEGPPAPDTASLGHVFRDEVRLDLGGVLDHGTRALFGLLRPDAEEPLTAPGWHLVHARAAWLTWLAQPWTESGDGGAVLRSFYVGFGRTPFWDAGRGMNIEADPVGDLRRALALTLEAVACRHH